MKTPAEEMDRPVKADADSKVRVRDASGPEGQTGESAPGSQRRQETWQDDQMQHALRIRHEAKRSQIHSWESRDWLRRRSPNLAPRFSSHPTQVEANSELRSAGTDSLQTTNTSIRPARGCGWKEKGGGTQNFTRSLSDALGSSSI